MKKQFLLILLLTVYSNLSASVYTPDKLLYNGKEYSIVDSKYLSHFFINKADHAETTPDGEVIVSTGPRQGYIGTFQIEDNQLYVTAIQKYYMEDLQIKRENAYTSLFPNTTRAKADWVSGLMLAGEIPEDGFKNGDSPKNYILLEIKDGTIIKEKKLNRKELNNFKKKQYQSFRNTEEYHAVFDRLKTEAPDYTSDKSIDETIELFILIHSTRILTD
ncbi:MAG: hypothetical protein ACK5KN_11405 [Dysgonomonas sp.]|jgi:hypothetical protein|uniref:hypothetical protein n=1 Tax=Dysgonomonas sp. TaxID=1891233 RepID=UPI002816CA82|nr:hypothetical protein [Prevotella sp.]